MTWCGAVPAAHPRAEGEPSAAGDGYIHGLHAFVGMAGNLYGLDGRGHAAGLSAGANRGPESRMAKAGDGLHHQRSRLPMLLPKLLPGACAWHSFSVPAWQNNQADRSLN